VESIYYVMSWACHRRCKHCYEDRFRPYTGDALNAVVAEAAANAPRIVDHLPERMTYVDRGDLDASGASGAPGAPREKPGRIIISGGESLLDPVREAVTYPTLERMQRRYRDQGVKLVVQTTGDLVTDAIVDDLLARGVWMLSCAGLDEFHVGIETEAKQAKLKDKLTRMFEAHGMRPSGVSAQNRKWLEESGPLFSFFGATPDSWIGKLWPRGRAWSNDLSRATIDDNFCNRWSGGLNFLNHRYAGSEVSIEPDGAVYPCCIKTGLPIGNLLEENLIDILESLAGDPVFEAINAGQPERMGLAHGWSVEDFIAKSTTTTPGGHSYSNLCIGCDRFHEEVLGPRVAAAKATRAKRRSQSPTEVSAS
jgi:sulfatase maturation enzyme AslB (radical SAM superfamily)